MRNLLSLLIVSAVSCRVGHAFLVGPNRPFGSMQHLTSSGHHRLHNSMMVDSDKQSESKDNFATYFKSTVKEDDKEMRLDQILAYTEISKLLNDGTVMMEDVNDLWISSVGDGKGLNVDDGFELVCMIKDLPDPEDEEFYDQEFSKLCGDNTAEGKLPYFKFLNWKDVQDMISEGVLSMEEITEIWRVEAGDLNASIDRLGFGRINMALDDKIEAKESKEGGGGASEAVVDEIDVSNLDVWSPAFDAKSAFDKDSLDEITAFYTSGGTTVSDMLSYNDFLEWADVKDMLAENTMTTPVLRKTWDEANGGKDTISYDQFLRLNVRMDLVMDELEEQQASAAPTPAVAAENDDDEDAESFYRSEFKTLAEGERLLRLDMLLEWKEIKDLIEDGAVQEKQIQKMFDGMPKEPMGIPSEVFGISEDTFVAFNGMLDVVLDAAGGGAPTAAVTPSNLVNEPAMPMPTQSELKMGDMMDPNAGLVEEGMSEAPDTGLTQEELSMMQQLDAADNMLNSGGYGDFDQLIGDLNDPRLEALREKDPTAEEVQGQLKDNLDELISLTSAAGRCGLDRPEEDDAARMRDLVQAVIEKAPKAASRDIDELRKAVNGDWKLLCTNSEMFAFYNGVTGFANVFPTTKFQDLSMTYQSDGYLAESKYNEKLNSPLGDIDCTVFSNWELVKEMSFMTNENSVVLRNYCTKVTAGPMEYEAEENWKSLRSMAMNELVYVDDRVKIMRNTGALRIFFVYLKQ